jgi:hypothetical protein
VVQGRKLRVDTTVVETNTDYRMSRNRREKRSRITATTGSRSVGERVTDGSVAAQKWSNFRGAKGALLLVPTPTTWEARVR